MTRLTIDFAADLSGRSARSGTRRLRSGWSDALLLAALVVTLAGAALEARHAADLWLDARDLSTAQAGVATLPAGTVTRRAAPAPLPRARVIAINAVIRQLDTPWQALLDAFETSTPPDVALLSIEPRSSGGNTARTIRVTAEAKDYDAILRDLDALQAQALFSSVALTRHDTNEQDANRPVRFGVELWLNDSGTP